MASSRAAASGIAGLVREVATQGAAAALARFDLEGLAGSPAAAVFLALTDVLCPPGGTIDEAIARDAMIETAAALATDGVGNFDELGATELEELFVGVVTRSVEAKILNAVGVGILRLAPDLGAVEQAQGMLHDFVDSCVRDALAGDTAPLTSVSDTEVEVFVSELYVAAFELMEAVGGESS